LWRFFAEEFGFDIFLAKFVWSKEQNRLKPGLVLENSEDWQNEIREKIDGKEKISSPEHSLKFIAGLDLAAAEGDESLAVASIVILSFPDLKICWKTSEPVYIDAPYLPGFLAFREVPPFCILIEKIRQHSECFPQVFFSRRKRNFASKWIWFGLAFWSFVKFFDDRSRKKFDFRRRFNKKSRKLGKNFHRRRRRRRPIGAAFGKFGKNFGRGRKNGKKCKKSDFCFDWK